MNTGGVILRIGHAPSMRVVTGSTDIDSESIPIHR